MSINVDHTVNRTSEHGIRMGVHRVPNLTYPTYYDEIRRMKQLLRKSIINFFLQKFSLRRTVKLRCNLHENINMYERHCRDAFSIITALTGKNII